MKRTFTLLTALLLLVSLLIPAVGAEEVTDSYDSANVSGAILYTLGASKDAVALRIYQTDILAFAENANIDDVLPSDHRYGGIIAISEDGVNFSYWTKSDYAPTYSWLLPNINQDALQFYLDTDISRYLGSDVQVINSFFISDARTGTAIYYRTNKGDYVYYDQEQIAPCLFSAEAFSAYLNFVIAISTMDNDHIVYKDLRFDVWDLSPYELGSPSFNPNADNIPRLPENFLFIVCIGILALIVVVLVVLVTLYRKKVKAHNPYEENQGTEFDPDFVIYHTINDYVDDADNLPLTPN